MTSNFATAMNTTTTWNGAVSLATPDPTGETSGRMSLYFKSVRGLNTPKLYEYLREAAQENIIDAFLLAFHIRDCRGGKGERDLGRRALIWLFLNYPSEFSKVVSLIPDYGRWDDLMSLWPSVLNLTDITHVRQNWAASIEDENKMKTLRSLQNSFVSITGKQLVKDRANMESKNAITVCAKWAPTEGDSCDREHKTVITLTRSMGINQRTYRKEFITPMRKYTNVVEPMMCKNEWGNIDFSRVPSCAMKRLKKAFEKHTPEEFSSWKEKLVTGQTEVKAKQLDPHELIHELRTQGGGCQVLEQQWKVLEEKVKEMGSLKDALCVCDVSGSMESWGFGFGAGKKPGFAPLDASIGLSLLVANSVSGPFNNHIITFHEQPTFHVVKPGTIHSRFLSLQRSSWGNSTNLQATFDLILTQAKNHRLSESDMPKILFIFSDMQFNQADRYKTNFTVIDQKYKKAGYKRPQIVFWNLVGSSDDFPVSVRDDGTALISGFSPSVMKAILEGKDFSPYSILRATLDGERYKPVRDALE